MEICLFHALVYAVSLKVRAQLLIVGDPSVSGLSVLALVPQRTEIRCWRRIADGNVDLSPHHHIVRDLIVAAARQTVRLQIIPRKDMVNMGGALWTVNNGLR